MDLIYADETKKDIGVIKYFDMDIAFGADENNFELTLNLDQHCCQVGYYIYIDNTEYGGIIDGITVDTIKKSVTYSGRSWHGILDGKVLKPDSDARNDNVGRIVSGEANGLIASMIEEIGLEDDFEVSDEDSEITIFNYQIERYESAYKAMLKMLRSSYAKLKMAWNHATNKVKLWAELGVDHTTLDNWDSTQLNFTITNNQKFTNHLVCIGADDFSDKGELIARPVIHLFCDANGVIQPYAQANPIKDSQYILDETRKVLRNKEEITEVLDISSSVDENYEPLASQPSDWNSNCEAYYIGEVDENGEVKYKSVEPISTEVYEKLTDSSAPFDWNTNFSSYYIKQGQEYVAAEEQYTYTNLTEQPSNWETNFFDYYYVSNHKPVKSGTPTLDAYKELRKKPKDWSKNYGDYYEFNGLDYVQVGGVSKDKYTVTESKPSRWDEVWGDYYYKTAIWKKKKVKKKIVYYKDKDGWLNANKYFDRKTHEQKEYRKVQKWKPKTYYVKSSYNIAPKFENRTYYKYKSGTEAPTFVANRFCRRNKRTTIPTYQANTYYEKVERLVPPAFTTNQYYRMVVDHYASIVEQGLSKFQEIIERSKSISIDFDGTEFYDIMDTVGASEQTTGIEVKQNIIKKIVTLTERKEVIEYEIGTEV